MYEPSYLPQMRCTLIPGLRFGLLYSDSAVRVGDPDIEPLHIHEYTEIFFNISSDVSFLVNNRLYPVGIGQAVIFGPEDLHVCIYNKSGAHKYFCLWIDGENILPDVGDSHLISFDKATEEELRRLLFSLDELCKNGDEIERTARLLDLICIIRGKRASLPTQAALPPALQEILDHINEDFTQIHSVNDIIAEHFISGATLNRWFRKYIHVSPREYLESKKLSYAARLLSEDATVTEACMRSGFSDCSHFIALFKRRFGDTPFRYKRKAVENSL